MSILVVGVSHRSAPLAVLEAFAAGQDSQDGVVKLLTEVSRVDHVREAAVISTCNRVEVYADVDRFHGSVEEISRLLAERARLTVAEAADNLYVHYDQGAVSHLLHVASGLDSMAIGESQILGQARHALRLGQELGTIGPSLNLLFQQALRVGKRVHAETGIDTVAPSLVEAALAGQVVAGRRAVIVGAGSMAALAARAVVERAPAALAVINRSKASALELAGKFDGVAFPVVAASMAEIEPHLASAEVLVACTGAGGVVIAAEQVAAARRSFGPTAIRPLTMIDLALPHDIDPEVAELPGVHLITLSTLTERLAERDRTGRPAAEAETDAELAAVHSIVTEEIAAFVAARQRAGVTPTVVALRSMATGVVESELARLESRLPELDAAQRAEVALAVRRVADKLLHQPTVRVRELAAVDDTVSYAHALAELFALDPETVAALTRAEGLP
ncbi:MAG: glutamyl-tRNA reductase [Nocardioides sp.]